MQVTEGSVSSQKDTNTAPIMSCHVSHSSLDGELEAFHLDAWLSEAQGVGSLLFRHVDSMDVVACVPIAIDEHVAGGAPEQSSDGTHGGASHTWSPDLWRQSAYDSDRCNVSR